MLPSCLAPVQEMKGKHGLLVTNAKLSLRTKPVRGRGERR